MYHYVYRITNILLNKHYYGSRSSKRQPKNDLGKYYFSSSHDECFLQDQRVNPQQYKYKIIRVFSTRKDAVLFEIKLHEYFNVGKNPLFYNKVKQTDTKFDSSGMININGEMITLEKFYTERYQYHSKNKVTVKNKDGETFQVSIHDKRYITGELINVQSGMVNAINEYGQSEWVTQQEYYNRNLSCNNTGKIPVKDKDGNCFLIDKNDERLNDGRLVHVFKGFVSAYNTITEKNEVVTKECFDNNKHLVGVNKGNVYGGNNPNAKTIEIFDNNNNKVYSSTGDFKMLCLKYNLPFISLARSYRNGGKPIYNSKRGQTDAKRNGMEQYIGWYAKIL